jgi:tetratricopeptide (TPR) repeat protein
LAEALGRCHATLGDIAAAIRLFAACRDHFRRRGDKVNEIRFACVLGYALTDAGRFSEAEEVLATGLEAGREIRDPLTRARLHYAQSRLKGEEGLVAEAARHAEAALETLRTTENTYFTSLAYQLLAALYNDLGRHGDALALLDEGRPGMLASATPIQLAHYDIEEARSLAALGEEERAAALAMEAAAGLGEAQPRDRGRAYVLLSEIYERLGETARARELCELGLEFLQALGPNRYLIAGYKRLAHLLREQGRPEEALDVLEQALDVQERAGRSI